MRRLVPIDATGTPAFVDALQRAWDRGDAVLPIDPRLPASAIERLLSRMRLDEPVGDDDALVVPTSGTTGEPKGVVLTHTAVAASARATSERLGVDPSHDHWLACLPLAHVGGLTVITKALVTGTPLTILPGFDADAVTRAATGGGATLVSLVPTAMRRLPDPLVFRRIVLGGSAPPPDRPANAVATYGMTETGSGVVYDGVPLDGVGVRVADDGEIGLRGSMLLRCYRDGSDPKNSEGWYATGDLGVWDDAKGTLSVIGRARDLIITGGENVGPAAVEAIIAAVPGVAEVVVEGRPDPEWGERVVAVVVPTDVANPPTLDQLREAVRERLSPWAAPKELELVEVLPRTALGKVRRTTRQRPRT